MIATAGNVLKQPGCIFDLVAQLVLALGLAPMRHGLHFLNAHSRVAGVLEKVNPVPALKEYSIRIDLHEGSPSIGMMYLELGMDWAVFSSRESRWVTTDEGLKGNFVFCLCNAINEAGAVPDFEEVGAWSRA